MNAYGNDLSDTISLILPPNKVWKFDLVRQNNKAFLQNDWPNFVEFYSLSHGHLLVFKYRGNSCFNVVIFDMSASEIDYPCHHETSRSQNQKVM